MDDPQLKQGWVSPAEFRTATSLGWYSPQLVQEQTSILVGAPCSGVTLMDDQLLGLEYLEHAAQVNPLGMWEEPWAACLLSQEWQLRRTIGFVAPQPQSQVEYLTRRALVERGVFFG